MSRVLIVMPADFRIEAMQRFGQAQLEDARQFAALVKLLGHEVELLEEPLVEPRSAYLAVRNAVERFQPTHVIERCYLWADPPNGHAVTLATPPDIPLGVSAYIAPEVGDAPLGEAPGEVFQLHTTCANTMTGRKSVRLFGPLTGPGSTLTENDLRDFLAFGELRTNVSFPDTILPIQPEHIVRAQLLLKVLRGRVMAMTGNHCMGMLPCHINVPYHCGANGWGLNIPIIPPDLFDWLRRFNERREHYLTLGRHYMQQMVARGFHFCFQRDENGRPLPPSERDYTPEVAAFQMALYAVMLDLTDELKIDLLGIPAQLLMTDHVVCGDLIKGVAMSNWGPEGRSSPLCWVTEGDMDAAISHWLLHDVTGYPPVFCDIRCYIPRLDAWMMCNSGAAAAEAAEHGWESCFSVRQYGGYFRVKGGGGTFAFSNPKCCRVIGLRTAVDQDGIYATIALGETVRSNDPRDVVDGRWPQYKVKVFDDVRKCRLFWPTNHFHWVETDDPIGHARVLAEAVRLVGGRVKLLGDPKRLTG